ncbi:MAG: VCBS repeat-containing protein, partial [SAR324 cluster bacterium]|nr:VCBS repeat-containing protein [SAR324 cluster bacterium]
MRRRFSFRQCWTTALLGILGLSGANSLPAAEDNAPIYQWQRQYYGKLNGQEQLLYTRGFERSILSFADFDGDGDEDLFVGKSDGRIALFRNPGDNQFRLETEDFSAFQEDVQ